MNSKIFALFIVFSAIFSPFAANAAPNRKVAMRAHPASSAQGRWHLDQNGCKIWNPSAGADKTLYWNGKCLDGLATGDGFAQWYDGDARGNATEGTMVKGHLTGNVTIWYPNDEYYEGPYSDAAFIGKRVRKQVVNSTANRVSIEKQLARAPTPRSPNENACSAYGFAYGSNMFGQCVLQLDQAREQAQIAERQYQLQFQQYQQQQAAFEAQQDAIKKERDRRKWEMLARLGAGMANSRSPSFLGAFNEGLAAANGVQIDQPVAPPPPPSQNYTLRLPNGNQVYCSYNAGYMSCR